MKTEQDPRVLLCDCAYAATLSPLVKQVVRRALTECGLRFDAVSDLCELAARKAPLLVDLAGSSQLTIAACHPRAVKWLFAAGGVPLPEKGVAYLDMRKGSTEEILRSIRDLASGIDTAVRAESGSTAPSPRLDSDSVAAAEGIDPVTPVWNPWFPVIDHGRCENCQQCLGFCLFGVYSVGADGRVQVDHPANCKTGCPACARVCPSAAIIFPKYSSAPINGGDVKDGDPLAEPVRVDKAALLSGDVISLLQKRGGGELPFSREPNQVRAIQERFLRLSGPRGRFDLSMGGAVAKPPTEESQ